MLKILDELKTTPGVLGSSIYSSKNGIIATNLPEIFKRDVQKRIGTILHQIFALDETIKLEANSFEIQYDEVLLIVKKLCKTSTLILICEPDAKIHLINMSVGMLTTDLLGLIVDCDQASAVQEEKIPLSHPPADPEEVINGPLKDELAAIKRALAKEIGPVAGKALKSAVSQWLSDGEPSRGRFKNLVDILQNEIDDESSRQEFIASSKELI